MEFIRLLNGISLVYHHIRMPTSCSIALFGTHMILHSFILAFIYYLEQSMRDHVKKQRPICRQDISLVSNPPIGMSFGPWNVSQSLPVKGATTNAFLFRFTEILLSKSAPNLDALIPLNRAKSCDPNDPTFTFIPILEGEIWNLLLLCLCAFAR